MGQANPETESILGSINEKNPHHKSIFAQSYYQSCLRTTIAKRRDTFHLTIRSRQSRQEGLRAMDLFRSFYLLTRISNKTSDSVIFRIHTKLTVAILITLTILVTTRQYVGNPIDCIHIRDIPEDVLNTYCWIHSTFIVVGANNNIIIGEDHHPGVLYAGNKTIRHVKYYQWTAFVLFFQAILFYTPRWLWKSWEGGKICALMMDLDVAVCSDIEKKQKKKLMIDYLWDNLRFHNWWAYRYYFCEVLALINVIGQMFLMNRFFDGAFLMFGFEVISFINADQEDRIDPMIQIFPRMTKCTFRKYGASGDEEKHDALCILPLNVVNEKIYVFLWFWFIILAILTLMTVIYRIIIIFSPRMRVYLLRMRYRLVRREVIDTIVRRSKMGDWFLFYMLGENIDSLIFRDVLQDLAHKLNRHDFHHAPGFKGEIQEA
ncbi:innexin shaking-B isoform X1 [Anthonomus grandis grandis]|uniref:innexin shaking-B isoform X1 n=1 Tax=Anthonomus grandis grandis TaxID=2921223 RepID=UPI00216594A6|nr:innexin shaking-B isoform X1 [Anthonomus grandis grandis]